MSLPTHPSTDVVAAPRTGLATAALVTGIVGVVLAFLLGWVGSLVGIAALVLALVSRRQVPGSAKPGLVLGIIAIVLGIVMTVVAGVVLAALGLTA